MESSKISSFAISYTVLLALWGPLWTKSIYSRPIFVYLSFMILAALFFICFIKSVQINSQQATSRNLWIPYIFFTTVSYILSGSIEHSVYWFSCLSMLFMGSSINFSDYFPKKLLLFSGIISVVGVAIQLMLPSFYSSNIAVLYPDDNLEKWLEKNQGCAGFSYQLAQCAIQIIYSIGVFFCFYFNNQGRKNFKQFILLLVLFIGLFLAGKRSLSAISIIAVLSVFYFSSPSNRKIQTLLLSGIIFSAIITIALNNLDYLATIPGLSRFADSVDNYNMGEDVSSGRDLIYAVAIKMFLENPILGVGVGNFANLSGLDIAVHNTYLQVLCEQGIIGFTIYIIPLLYCLFSTIAMLRKHYNDSNIGYLKISLFIQLVYIMYSFTGNPSVNLYGFMFYFLAISLLIHYKSNC